MVRMVLAASSDRFETDYWLSSALLLMFACGLVVEARLGSLNKADAFSGTDSIVTVAMSIVETSARVETTRRGRSGHSVV